MTAFSAFSNGPTVLAALQNVNTSAPVAECVQFLDNSFFFGSVKSADVKMGGSSNTGEVASSVPIHVMGDTSVPTGADALHRNRGGYGHNIGCEWIYSA